MTFRILHFAADDKFIPLIMDLYEEAFPGQNEFRILNRGKDGVRHVPCSNSIRFVKNEYFRSGAMDWDFDSSDCLIVHAMRPQFVRGIRRAPERLLIVWYGWGFDYAHYIEQQLGPSLLEDTRKVSEKCDRRERINSFVSTEGLRQLVRKQPKKMLERAKDKLSYGNAELAVVAARIDMFAVNPSEAPRVKTALPRLRATYQMLHYFTTEDTLDKGPRSMSGPDILLGNSAYPTNNHIEAFNELVKCKLEGRRIIVPLSYGPTEYANYICRLGKKYFGSSFIPLREYLDIDRYNRFIETCGVVVMNHIRQQAVGNISTSLYKGAQVVLRRESALYDFYTSLGTKVYCIGDLQAVCEGKEKLNDQQAERNREIMREFWSRKRAIRKIKELKNYYPRMGVRE